QSSERCIARAEEDVLRLRADSEPHCDARATCIGARIANRIRYRLPVPDDRGNGERLEYLRSVQQGGDSRNQPGQCGQASAAVVRNQAADDADDADESALSA